jgi:molybdopterin converting factor small subunit
MVTVRIPSLMRDLTGGQAQVAVEGRTVGAVVDALERAYPGVQERLLRDGKLDPALRAVVDGRVSLLGLAESVRENSEVQFIPTVAGG